MYDQWEYKLLIGRGLRQNLRDAEGVEYGQLSQELLNRLGKEGWEVCSHWFSFVSPRILILKRKITSGSKQMPPSAGDREAEARRR